MNTPRPISLLLAATLAFGSLTASRADDIDLFLGNQPVTTPGPTANPNVLLIIDNTSNWNTRYSLEMSAITSVINALPNVRDVNIGFMMQTGGSYDGGFVRFGVRQMTPANVTVINSAVGTITAGDKANNGTPGLNFYEAYRYFSGGAWYMGQHDTHYDYPLNSYAGFTMPADGRNAFLIQGGSNYNPPPMGGCNSNYIIYIGNGNPSQQSNEADGPLATINQNASGACRKLINVYSERGLGTPTDVPAVNSQTFFSNTACGEEWSRFLYTNGLPNGQNVTSYAIEIGPVATGRGPDYTQYMRIMANEGHGKYFGVTNTSDNTQLVNILKQIFEEILAKSSTFASASLPISVNVQGTYLNQVYMGQFRPDGDAKPRWYGNLKQYQLGCVTPGLVYDTTCAAGDSLALLDINHTPIVNSAGSGFVSPAITSFWSTAEAYVPATPVYGFWLASPSGSGTQWDAPDGEVVEKGAAAQRLRSRFAQVSKTATNATAGARKVYTCTSCTTTLSNFDTGNASITQAALGASSSTDRDNLINWIRGADNVSGDEPSPGSPVTIRPSVHGDVLHSRPAVVNYGGSTGVVVYYGANDGTLHAINGSQTPRPSGNTSASGSYGGEEMWAFVASESFGRLKRLRDNSPLVKYATQTISITPTPTARDYFFDGPLSVYYLDANKDLQITSGSSGDKVYLFAGMRRGGSIIYAFDATTPTTPTLLWRKVRGTDAGYGELGQTWSTLQVAKINATTHPVLIFGAGYDTAQDAEPPTTASTGRGIMVVDATNGTVLWQAGPNPSGATTNKTVSGMTYPIAADVTVVDRNFDGKADRIYAVDLGGNIWRADIDDANPANWTVTWLASLGYWATHDPALTFNLSWTNCNGSTLLGTFPRRKFFYPPAVVPGTSYDAVLVGSGDREHPINCQQAAQIQNYFYMLRDTDIGLGSTGSATTPTITQDNLDDANGTINTAHSGWYFALQTGEKAVNAPVVVAGTVFFGTNQSPQPSEVTCPNLGNAFSYSVAYDTGVGQYGGVRYTPFDGGGLPPSPVVGVVDLGTSGGKQPFIIGAKTSATAQGGGGVASGLVPLVVPQIRSRIYWYNLID